MDTIQKILGIFLFCGMVVLIFVGLLLAFDARVMQIKQDNAVNKLCKDTCYPKALDTCFVGDVDHIFIGCAENPEIVVKQLYPKEQ